MTSRAEEIAKEVVSEIYNRFNRCRTKRHLNLIPLIASAVDSARKEAVEEWKKEFNILFASVGSETTMKAIREESRKAAFERAAEIAESYDRGWGSTIAQAIREEAGK